MNERELKLLLEASAIKSILLIAQGAAFHVEVKTAGWSKVLLTGRGDVRQWRSIDSSAKWVRKAGIGKFEVDMQAWQGEQKAMSF
jgi:hypothetical protein